MSEPDDETIQALKESIAFSEKVVADLETRNAQIAKLNERIDKLDEADRRRAVPTMQGDAPPATTAELVERRRAELARLLDDPKSSQADRHTAMRDVQRAERKADDEAKQVQHFAAMGRSLALRAEEAAQRDEAVRQRQADDAAFRDREKQKKWSAAARDHFIKTGVR